MYGHQVVGLAAGFWEALGQKLIKGVQSLQPPVLLGSNLTQVFPQLHKAHITLLLLGPFPGQDLIDLAQDERGPWGSSFGDTAIPLIHKLVKPVKIICSCLADQVCCDQLPVVQAKSHVRAADTAILGKANATVGIKVAGLDLADGGLDQRAEFPPLLFCD